MEKELSKLTSNLDMGKKSKPAAIKKFKYEKTAESYAESEEYSLTGRESKRKKEFLEDFYDYDDGFIDRNRLKKKNGKKKKSQKFDTVLEPSNYDEQSLGSYEPKGLFFTGLS